MVQEFRERLGKYSRISDELEDQYIENGGEITEETTDLEGVKTIVKDAVQNDCDNFGRYIASKKEEKDRWKAEKGAIDRRIKAIDNSISFFTDCIIEAMKVLGTNRVKGDLYGFTKTVSETTKVDADLVNERYLALAEKAIRAAGVPDYIQIKLEAKVSLVPEGEELPDVFTVDTKDAIRFTKPRAAKE